MKIKLKQLIDARGAIPSNSSSGSAKTRYKMAKFLVATQDDFQIYAKQYNDIMLECGEANEDGSFGDQSGFIKIKPDMVKTYQEKKADLAEIEVEAPDINFTETELEEMGLSVNDIVRLFPFIKEEE